MELRALILLSTIMIQQNNKSLILELSSKNKNFILLHPNGEILGSITFIKFFIVGNRIITAETPWGTIDLRGRLIRNDWSISHEKSSIGRIRFWPWHFKFFLSLHDRKQMSFKAWKWFTRLTIKNKEGSFYFRSISNRKVDKKVKRWLINGSGIIVQNDAIFASLILYSCYLIIGYKLMWKYALFGAAGGATG